CLYKEFLHGDTCQRKCFGERMNPIGSLGRKKPPSKIGYPFWWREYVTIYSSNDLQKNTQVSAKDNVLNVDQH
ncbi:MAG: hypothetical protein AAF335_04875, partial [Bacteroidota bacterium]